MDILSPLLKPKIFNIRGKFLLGLKFTLQSDIQINLNSYNTFTGNVILDLHAVPGFGIATLLDAPYAPENIDQIHDLIIFWRPDFYITDLLRLY